MWAGLKTVVAKPIEALCVVLFSLIITLAVRCRLGWLRQEVEGTHCATRVTRSTIMELMMFTGSSLFI